MPEKRVVLVVGAGASKAFGYPLTSEILPRLINCINENNLFNDAGSNKELYTFLLKQLILELSPGLKYLFGSSEITNLDSVPLVTDLLSQVDHFIACSHDIKDWNFELRSSKIKKPTGLTDRLTLRDLKVIFELGITEVISTRKRKNPNFDFISSIRKINEGNRAFVSVVTTNYDTLIEWYLLKYGEAAKAYKLIDYGFSWRDIDDGEVYQRLTKPLFRVLKLHGSLDWVKCERCGHIYINTCTSIFDLVIDNKKLDYNSCHCGYWPLTPVLVTPSYVRSNYDTNLHEIWKATLEELRLADHWIIAGYSLPNEDFNIKSLLLRALKGRDKLPQISVIQKGDSARQRYENFFGEENLENFYTEGLLKVSLEQLVR